MKRKLPATPQISVVAASEIWPSLSRHKRALQVQKSGSNVVIRVGMGRISTSDRGIWVLNHAARK